MLSNPKLKCGLEKKGARPLERRLIDEPTI
jgi:hypothetical protein